GAAQASQRVSQLLMDATISHRLDMRDARPTSVDALIDEVRQRLDPAAAARLSVSVPDEAGRAELFADRVVVREMLRNVVDNAMLYSTGPVEIAAESPEPGTVVLSVRDRGPGIPDGEKETVLQRFKRGSAGEGKTGSGLGLAIVKRVVDSHGGSLRLADRDGGGLIVEMALPLRRRKPAAPAAAAALAVAGLFVAALLAAPGQGEAAENRYPAPQPPPEGERTLTIVGTT